MLNAIISGLIVNGLTKLAEWYGPEDAIDKLAEKFDVDLKAKVNPVEQVHDLPDEDGTVYLWRMPDATPQQRMDLQERMRKEFVQTYHRDPKALHLFVTDEVDEIKELDPETIRDKLEPWLDDNL